jgi:hypothetical protein
MGVSSDGLEASVPGKSFILVAHQPPKHTNLQDFGLTISPN